MPGHTAPTRYSASTPRPQSRSRSRSPSGPRSRCSSGRSPCVALSSPGRAAGSFRNEFLGPAPSTLVALELDHVLIAVTDLAAAGHELEARHGLASIEGGRHPGWGTANRIVPLGDAYLELVAVVDEAEAARNPFGSWVAQAAPIFAKPLGWAVRTDTLDEVARRLDLVVAAGSRAARDGRLQRWRLAGVERAAAEPFLPFFIEWEQGTPPPGRAPASHRVAGVRIARLHLDGDVDRLAAWLGPHELPITARPGTPALTSIVLTGAAGEIVLDPGLL